MKSVLPPETNLRLEVLIALPAEGDVAADEPAPALPAGPEPMVTLEVVVRGDVWKNPPAPQLISLSRQKLTNPSTSASFEFTTPAAGGLVNIGIDLFYRGKPLQSATFVSPVRAEGFPGEKPTLTTHTLSGPDEPTDDLRPVDATLDARTGDLHHKNRPDGGHVAMGDVQEKLNTIEGFVSKVLGVTGAPDSFDDARVRELLITLARRGNDLRTLLKPLHLEKAMSINLTVNPQTPVLPLELVYQGPAPDRKLAKLCRHVDDPPPKGEACDRVSTRIVCPYAFWGLHRTISRTVEYQEPEEQRTRVAGGAAASTILYASTIIADDGATAPAPSDRVEASATRAFSSVTRVKNWRDWRKVVKTDRPDLLVVLGHTLQEGGETSLYIGKKSSVRAATSLPRTFIRAPAPSRLFC